MTSQLPKNLKDKYPSRAVVSNSVQVCVEGVCLSMGTYARMSHQKRLKEAAPMRHHNYHKLKRNISSRVFQVP